MDLALVVFGACMVLVGLVVSFVGVSYRPEATPLIPAQPREFGVASKSLTVVGSLAIGLGVLGTGGLLLAAVGCAAFQVARSD